MKRWIKRLGIAAFSLVGLLVLAGAGLYGVTGTHVRRSYDVKVEHVNVPNDAAAVERGKRFVSVIGKCVECHGANLQGQVMMDDPVFARLAATNLTRGKGGVGHQYQSDADWVRAIRHGVGPDGKALIFMPSSEYYYISDQDLGDVVAYLKALPPQDNELPTPRLGPIARGLFAAKKLPLFHAELIDHGATRPVDPTPSADATYGSYLARVGGCKGCHSENLAGGAHGGPPGPVPTNLTPAGNLGKWSEQDFFTALRTGKRPDGSQIDPAMPWALTAQMTDDEIRAVWAYLKTVPAVQSATE